MKSLCLILIAFAVSAASCRKKDSQPAPARESLLNKQGSISGTITYIDNGSNVTTDFDYQYFDSIQENKFYYIKNGFDAYYGLSFGRKDLNDKNNYFNFYIEGNSINGIENDPNYVSNHFLLRKVINNKIEEFYIDGNQSQVTNLTLDDSTGRLICDFYLPVYHGGSLGSIAGKVDVILILATNNQ